MSEPWLSLVDAGAAFAMGALGGPHCVGMCGGIATALSAPADPGVRNRAPIPLLPLWLALGRISTYAALGAIVGAVGGIVAGGLPGALAPVMRGALGLLLVAVGLSVSGWWPGSMAWLEALGGMVWKRLSPIGRSLLPVDSIGGGLAAGALWGLLPCGLVYGALAAATAAGDSASGAAWMLFFGVGTVPAVAGAGWLAGGLRAALSRREVRRGAGAILIAAGIWTAATPVWFHTAHGSHGASAITPHGDHHEGYASPDRAP